MHGYDLENLSASGAAFRQEVFTDAYTAAVGQHIHRLPDAVIGQFALTDLHHVTNASRLPAIKAEGLQPTDALVDEPDKAFFDHVFAEQMQRIPRYSDADLVKKHIFGRNPDGSLRGVYLTGAVDPLHMDLYAVPERLKFFMRNLHHLAHTNQPEVTRSTRQQAEVIVQKYASRIIINGQVEAIDLRIDPRSPVIGTRFLPSVFAETDTDTSVRVLSSMQQDTNIEIGGLIAPKHITVADRQSLDGERVLAMILGSDAHVVFRGR